VRTLVVSDLHLGLRSGADVLRRPLARERLTARLQGVEQLVLLGDVLELRHGPVRDALAVARPVLRELGEALGDGGRVLVVPGNHDHALVAPWLEARGRSAPPPPLGLDQRVSPRRASHLAAALERALAPASVEVAYPGAWLRDDVYATHGHYLDAHGSVPTFERLAAGIMARLVGAPPAPEAEPDDYERVLAPIYAWIHATSQHAFGGRPAASAGGSAHAFTLLSGGGRRPLATAALAGLFPVAVLAANRLGLGNFRADLRGGELRRSSLRAMGEAVGRLRVGAHHVLFGHSHRTGALPDDDPLEWRTLGGARLHNAGNWVFETQFLSGPDGASPYWPGGALALDDDGPPHLERLLLDVPAEDLRAPGSPPPPAEPGSAA
jgi:hypothetical protein